MVVATTTAGGSTSPRLSSFDKAGRRASPTYKQADRALLERLADYDEEFCQERRASRVQDLMSKTKRLGAKNPLGSS